MSKLFSHILLVDDDTITNYVNENLLEEMKVAEQIQAVQDGGEALAFIQNHWSPKESVVPGERKKLILLDIHMIPMDGFEFLERLEKMPSIQNLWVIILATSQYKRDVEKAKAFKVKAFIEKPLTKEKLETLLAQLRQ